MNTSRNRSGSRAILAALCAVPLLGGCLQPADEIIERSGSRSLVFVKEASIGRNSSR